MYCRSSILTAYGLGARGIALAVDYEHDIKPLLAAKCTACHGALEQEAGLRLDAGKLIHRGGDEGPAVLPGEASKSLLLQRIEADDPAERMPPEGEGEPLNADQVALLRTWIENGAEYPADEEVLDDPAEHWAYQVPLKADLPEVEGEFGEHPIDRLIASEHQRLGACSS